jgi:hypothetical protein
MRRTTLASSSRDPSSLGGQGTLVAVKPIGDLQKEAEIVEEMTDSEILQVERDIAFILGAVSRDPHGALGGVTFSALCP